MAAGQRKKRSTGSSVHEHYKGKKKKKLDSFDYALNLRSHVYLEWDANQKKAVAKREQIGITWKDMARFVDSAPRPCSGLADVVCVPPEIYSLDNLMQILSYEVWATCLSESERKLLTQFLPCDTGVEQAVQSLLSGENHHFGNPFRKWSTLLFSGNFHPDAILRGERQVRYQKKQYYSHLTDYHSNMVEDLKYWKDRWTHCGDPENLWSNALVTPEEKSMPMSSERIREAPQITYIRNVDIVKYMSYIKISKKQHETIENLKHSGEGIQFKSLSCVLGDINSYHICPYEALEEEQNIRLRDHWLQVVQRDLQVAYERRRKRKLERERLNKCLEEELSKNVTSMVDKIETVTRQISTPEKTIGGESENYPADIPTQEVSVSINSDQSHQLECLPSLSSHQVPSPMVSNEEAVVCNVLTGGDEPPSTSQLNREENLVEGFVKSEPLSSPVMNIWKAVGGPKDNSFPDFSLRKHVPAEEQHPTIIDLERDAQCETRETDGALLSLYASQIRNGLPSFTKGAEILASYPHVHTSHLKLPEGPELPFLTADGGLSETVQFTNQFQAQQNLLEQRYAGEKDHLYMRLMTNRSLYSSGSYPSQELYSSENSAFPDRNWFPDDHRNHNNNWEPSNSASQCLGDGGSSDGSLFSVLTACRNISSGAQHNTTHAEQMMEARNFSPSNENIYGYIPHQLRHSNSHELAAASTTGTHLPWTNFPASHQNSSNQDYSGRQFVRSWNQ